MKNIPPTSILVPTRLFQQKRALYHPSPRRAVKAGKQGPVEAAEPAASQPSPTQPSPQLQMNMSDLLYKVEIIMSVSVNEVAAFFRCSMIVKKYARSFQSSLKNCVSITHLYFIVIPIL